MSQRTSRRATALLPSAITLAVFTMMGGAQAQQAAAPPAGLPEASARVEVTGSMIRRLSDQTALPVSTTSAAELDALGVIQMRDFLLDSPYSDTIGAYAGTVGTLVNLRGLGQARSLTLMNGRRFANEPLTDQYVSVNTIPKIALAKVESLLDGASSIYGSDAIGGVQNYITQRSFNGLLLTGNAMTPQASGGGQTKYLGIMGGIGNLKSSGWNVFGAFDGSTRDVLFKRDRPNLSGLNADGTPNTALSPDLIAMGLAGTTELSVNQSSPANFLVAKSGLGVPTGTAYNPYAATGCDSPNSVRTNATALTCSENIRYLDTGTYGNGTEQYNAYGRGTLVIGDGHQLSLELNHSQNIIKQYSGVIAGVVSSNYYLSLPKTSPYYPGGTGGVPAVVVAGKTIADANVAASPSTLYVRWLPIDAGLPVLSDEHLNDRAVLNLEGVVMGWDYRTGLDFGKAQRNTQRSNVYYTADLQAGLNNGSFNPFGAQSAAGLAMLQSMQLDEQTRRQAETTNRSWDFSFTKDVYQLPGGSVNVAFGGELRRNTWSATGYSTNNLTSVPGAILTTNNNIASNPNFNKVPTVWLEANPNSNQPDDTMNGYASRDVSALYGEVEVPVTKTLTMNLAVRGDKYKYSAQTISSVNPKISARWQPTPMFMMRGSANTGFRAPSLPEIYGNADEFKTSTGFDDPLYCNSSSDTVNAAGAAKGLATIDVCNIDLMVVTKSKSAGAILKPETSKAFTVGFGVQPLPQVQFQLDYWATQIDDVLGILDENTMAAYYSLYEKQFIRDPNGKLNRLLDSKANVGQIQASGIDASLRLNFVTEYGTILPRFDLAYRNEFKSLPVGTTQWISALAQSEPAGITTQDGLTGNRAQMNRFKYLGTIGWRYGPWGATWSHRYQSKLTDRNEASRVNAPGSEGVRDVAPYSQFNMTASYTGVKDLTIMVGINNITNVNPPLTNNSRYQGYLTQNADVEGRAFQLSATYQY